MNETPNRPLLPAFIVHSDRLFGTHYVYGNAPVFQQLQGLGAHLKPSVHSA